MCEAQKWISIERLLDEYSIPVLAEAVDKFDVQTHDKTGRRILATDGDENDVQSKSFVKAHLARRYSFQLDPLTEEEQYWFDEKIQTHGSALDWFGWPEDQLPDFKKIQPHYRPEDEAELWTKRPIVEFEEELKLAGSLTNAGVIHGVSRQRYTAVITKKRAESKFGKS